MAHVIWTLLFSSLLHSTLSLDNGLALTPPMGWMSWERFRCITDCNLYPDDCVSEKLYRTMADLLVENGYAAVGYEYVILDDCWMAKERDEQGRLQADLERFPNGIKALADYVHSKGLKLGIYEDFGTLTCGGYPGSIENLELDAQTFAAWEVDYVKFDGCYADPSIMDEGYPEFGKYLRATNRSIVYSCSWPVYQDETGIDPNLTLIAEHCNLWRNFDDIQDSWASVTYIMDWYTDKQELIAPHHGPGHWNDPDMRSWKACDSDGRAALYSINLADTGGLKRMHIRKGRDCHARVELRNKRPPNQQYSAGMTCIPRNQLIIGNYGLSLEQSKAQMAVWAVMAAPLIMSNDLRTISPEFRDILINPAIIAVDQDKLGIQGRRVYDVNDIEIYTKPIEPIVNNAYSWAISVVSRRDDGAPRAVTVPLIRLRIQGAPAYNFTDLFTGLGPINISSDAALNFRIPPSGGRMFKAVALSQPIPKGETLQSCSGFSAVQIEKQQKPKKPARKFTPSPEREALRKALRNPHQNNIYTTKQF